MFIGNSPGNKTLKYFARKSDEHYAQPRSQGLFPEKGPGNEVALRLI